MPEPGMNFNKAPQPLIASSELKLFLSDNEYENFERVLRESVLSLEKKKEIADKVLEEFKNNPSEAIQYFRDTFEVLSKPSDRKITPQ